MEDIMNPNNYATLEACQRLVDAGIVLETDIYWCDNLGWISLRSKQDTPEENCDWKIYPAPSMAEVWREYRKHVPDYQNRGKLWNALREEKVVDALIDLLIWLTAQKEG
jgi:hypothetical protein